MEIRIDDDRIGGNHCFIANGDLLDRSNNRPVQANIISDSYSSLVEHR